MIQYVLPEVPDDLGQLSEAWWVEGSRVLRGGLQVRGNYGPGLERLAVGDR